MAAEATGTIIRAIVVIVIVKVILMAVCLGLHVSHCCNFCAGLFTAPNVQSSGLLLLLVIVFFHVLLQRWIMTFAFLLQQWQN